jgi:hypothetical protein
LLFELLLKRILLGISLGSVLSQLLLNTNASVRVSSTIKLEDITALRASTVDKTDSSVVSDISTIYRKKGASRFESPSGKDTHCITSLPSECEHSLFFFFPSKWWLLSGIPARLWRTCRRRSAVQATSVIASIGSTGMRRGAIVLLGRWGLYGSAYTVSNIVMIVGKLLVPKPQGSEDTTEDEPDNAGRSTTVVKQVRVHRDNTYEVALQGRAFIIRDGRQTCGIGHSSQTRLRGGDRSRVEELLRQVT